MALTDEQVHALRVGDVSEWDGVTRKVVIIAETADGRFVCQHYPTQGTRLDGSVYWSPSNSGLFLVNKDEVKENGI